MEMIDIGFGLKIRKDRIKEIIEEVGEAKLYAVIASRIDGIHKCDILADKDEILLFGEEAWNEPFFGSWTEDRELYENGGVDVLVTKIEISKVSK